MISISLSTEDLTKVRLAPSPLWETVTSFAVLLHRADDTVHAPWVTRTRRVLPGTDLFPLLATMCLEKHCPDFLTPPPDASAATFGEELGEAMAALFVLVTVRWRMPAGLLGVPPAPGARRQPRSRGNAQEAQLSTPPRRE